MFVRNLKFSDHALMAKRLGETERTGVGQRWALVCERPDKVKPVISTVKRVGWAMRAKRRTRVRWWERKLKEKRG